MTGPTTFDELRPQDQELLHACSEGNLLRLYDSLKANARLDAHFTADHPLSGKSPIHAAAASGFVEGVDILVKLGADIESREHQTRANNTPLLLAKGHQKTFAHLVAMGADLDAKNGLGYAPRFVYENPPQPDPPERQRLRQQLRAWERDHQVHDITQFPPRQIFSILTVFNRLPNVPKSFAGMSADQFFERNEHGLCLMDNPRFHLRIRNAVAESQKTENPLDLLALLKPVPRQALHLQPDQMPPLLDMLRVGASPSRAAQASQEKNPSPVTYLERIMQTGCLAEAVIGLNEGEIQAREDILLENGRASPIMAAAARHHQLDAFFTAANWQGANLGELRRAYRQVPPDSRWRMPSLGELIGSIGENVSLSVGREDVIRYAAENRAQIAAGGDSTRFIDWAREQGIEDTKWRGLKLAGADLSDGDFSFVESFHSTLQEADLTKARFDRSVMEKTCFKGAMVKDASFRSAVLNGSNFTGAKLLGSGQVHQECGMTDFSNVQADGAIFDQSEIRQTSFVHGSLIGASFSGAEIRQVDFRAANLLTADFSGLKVSPNSAHGRPNTNFFGATLVDAKHTERLEGFDQGSLSDIAALADRLRRDKRYCIDGLPALESQREDIISHGRAARSVIDRQWGGGDMKQMEVLTQALDDLRRAAYPKHEIGWRRREVAREMESRIDKGRTA